MSLPTSGEALDRHLVSGVAWTAAARAASQILSWGSLILLARLLAPSDFGLLGLATIYLGFIAMISSCGIDSAIVAMPDQSRSIVRQLNTVSVLFGLASTAVTIAAAVPVALFFHSPELRLAIPVMGIGFTLSGFATVPQALLQREMRFKRISGIEGVQSSVQAVSAVLMAWAGMGYWSLILSGLIGTAVVSLMPVLLVGPGFAIPRKSEIGGALTFSGQILMSRLFWYCYSNADFVVAGRVLGNAELGIYTMAWNVASIPAEKVTVLIARVTPSVFSRVQNQPGELRRYTRLVTEALALLTFPVGFGLALTAQPLVAVAFDPRWRAAATPLSLLALYMVLRCVATFLPQVLNVLGDAKFVMWQSLGALIVFPPGFYFASRWGGTGIAAVWSCVFPFVTAPLFWRVFRKTGLSLAEYVQAIKPAALASGAMTVAVLTLHHSLLKNAPAMLTLAMEAAVGAAVYAAILLLFFPQRVQAFRSLIFQKKAE